MAEISLKGLDDRTPMIAIEDKPSIPTERSYKWIYLIIGILVVIVLGIVIIVVGLDRGSSNEPIFRSGPPVDDPTQPYWLQDAPFQNISTGDFPSNVNITIIGAGMSGASILYHLVKYLNENISTYNTSILLIDARGASGGATGRNGGILSILGVEAFNSTLTNFGEDTAVARYNFSKQCINEIIQFINDYNIDANLRFNPSLATINTNDEEELQSIQDAIDKMNSYGIGFEDQLLNTEQMRNISKSDVWTNGIYKNASWLFWPAKVVFGLLNYSILNTNNSLNVNENTKINLSIQFNKVVDSVTFNEDDQNWLIQTKDNDEINSEIVVYATNGYTSYLLPEYSNKIYPAKNQVIISRIINETIWPNVGSFGDDYEYYNQRVTGRLLIGGGRQDAPNNWINNYDDSDIDENVENYLQNYLYQYYPHIKNGSYMDNFYMQWQGIMGFTDDGLPYVGPLVDKINAYICAGYTGSGMSYAFTSGKAIANMIMGRTPIPFVDAFLPSSRGSLKTS